MAKEERRDPGRHGRKGRGRAEAPAVPAGGSGEARPAPARGAPQRAGERSHAPERREEILEAAIREFARFGLYGTSVDAIADQVGISQPYIFRLYGTKKELFIAAALRVCQRIQQAFDEASRKDPGHILRAMGQAYAPLLSSRAELMVLLHAFAASEDREVREAVGARYAELWKFVETRSGAGRADVMRFFAEGMGMTVGAALGLQHLFAHSHEGGSRG